MKRNGHYAIKLSAVCLLGMLAACSSRVPLNNPSPSSPVENRNATDASGKRPETYTVVRGDSLSAIGQRYGLSVADLQRLNNLGSSVNLQAGQVLRLSPVGASASPAPASTPTAPVASTPAPAGGAVTGSVRGGGVESKPLENKPVEPRPEIKQAEKSADAKVPEAKTAEPVPPKLAVVTAPRGLKRPYSDALYSELSGIPLEPVKLEPPKGGFWNWPANGKVTEDFNLPNQKGLLIAAKVGDPVVAASDGNVIFSGEGPRGFGNLVIVKHSNDMVSVYGNNKLLLVKEGQAVKKGTKLAEIGNSGNGKTGLIFEVRQSGKPFDPNKLLQPKTNP